METGLPYEVAVNKLKTHNELNHGGVQDEARV